jgi:hypothetical protein
MDRNKKLLGIDGTEKITVVYPSFAIVFDDERDGKNRNGIELLLLNM